MHVTFKLEHLWQSVLSSSWMHLTLQRLHSLLLAVNFFFEGTGAIYTYHAVEVYLARFEREDSGASCAGRFCDEFDNALLPLASIVDRASHKLRQRKI